MSGGSYDYAYQRIADLAEEIRMRAEGDHVDLRAAFAAHLEKCAEAARAIEWVDSGDSGPGREVAPIREALKGGRDLRALFEQSVEIARELGAADVGPDGTAHSGIRARLAQVFMVAMVEVEGL
jgi:hypothetical protein